VAGGDTREEGATAELDVLHGLQSDYGGSAKRPTTNQRPETNTHLGVGIGKETPRTGRVTEEDVHAEQADEREVAEISVQRL
jgi:hypothetical protein